MRFATSLLATTVAASIACGLGSPSETQLQQACDQLDFDACAELGETLLAGPDRQRGAEVLLSACTAGSGVSCLRLGKATLQDPSLDAEGLTGARGSFSFGCDQGHPPSCGQYGYVLIEGIGGDKDPTRAFEVSARACDSDDAGPDRSAFCHNAGIAASTPDAGPAFDLVVALAYFMKGCTLGDDAQCLIVAKQYTTGELVPADPTKAKDALDVACKRGNAEACAGLAP